ncbi:hypothetical protein V474_11640 [Novosphingobium barchaimii LL02]|uniref:Uncharacterized protein n=1 Tax=Novosphingobium barchaimii LL02 TaxID=1114963 RepID=A0A0J7Y899_9SPHN|nr:hypothetical protein [Novosphingobium barchaimii]KMS60041.1 hypothetical protein V474_11640 [Novosphingobium barchaimii LL02]
MIHARAPLVAALALLFAAPAAADEPPGWPVGLYGSVRMSEQTGDLGGLELRFFAEGGKPIVEAVLCEGWCNTSYIAPLERTAEGFAFRYFERYESGAGPSEEAVRITLKPVRSGFLATLTTESDPENRLWEEASKLKGLKQPFGLAVVNNAKK